MSHSNYLYRHVIDNSTSWWICLLVCPLPPHPPPLRPFLRGCPRSTYSYRFNRGQNPQGKKKKGTSSLFFWVVSLFLGAFPSPTSNYVILTSFCSPFVEVAHRSLQLWWIRREKWYNIVRTTLKWKWTKETTDSPDLVMRCLGFRRVSELSRTRKKKANEKAFLREKKGGEKGLLCSWDYCSP